jgi:hypothetical protein
VLADFRPNAKAIAELQALFGQALEGVGEVAAEWRDAHELWPALAVTEDEFCHLDAEVELRTELERELATLLALHDMDHLDITHVRSRDRIVTQTVSPELYERRYAGVRFGSKPRRPAVLRAVRGPRRARAERRALRAHARA